MGIFDSKYTATEKCIDISSLITDSFNENNVQLTGIADGCYLWVHTYLRGGSHKTPRVKVGRNEKDSDSITIITKLGKATGEVEFLNDNNNAKLSSKQRKQVLAFVSDNAQLLVDIYYNPFLLNPGCEMLENQIKELNAKKRKSKKDE